MTAVVIWTDATDVGNILRYGIGPTNRNAMANKKLPTTETAVDVLNLLQIYDSKYQNRWSMIKSFFLDMERLLKSCFPKPDF